MKLITKPTTSHVQRIIEAVAESFNVDAVSIVLEQATSTRKLSTARSVCAFLLKDKIPKDKIASLLGRKNNQYAYAAIERVYAKSQADHEYHARVDRLACRFGVRWN